MLSIEEIIFTGDLKKLFREIMDGKRSVFGDKHVVIKRIRALAPLSIIDLEGVEDDDVFAELEKHGRWSVLKEIQRNKKRKDTGWCHKV